MLCYVLVGMNKIFVFWPFRVWLAYRVEGFVWFLGRRHSKRRIDLQSAPCSYAANANTWFVHKCPLCAFPFPFQWATRCDRLENRALWTPLFAQPQHYMHIHIHRHTSTCITHTHFIHFDILYTYAISNPPQYCRKVDNNLGSYTHHYDRYYLSLTFLG